MREIPYNLGDTISEHHHLNNKAANLNKLSDSPVL